MHTLHETVFCNAAGACSGMTCNAWAQLSMGTLQEHPDASCFADKVVSDVDTAIALMCNLMQMRTYASMHTNTAHDSDESTWLSKLGSMGME